MMEIIRHQRDEDNDLIVHMLLGGIAADTHYRLARLSMETDDPEQWVLDNQGVVQAAIDIGQVDLTRETKIDFNALANKVASELEWLDETIPLISTMTGAEVRDVVARIAREQREELRAWRYIFRRLV